MMKTINWHEQHYSILEIDYHVYWSMVINPKADKIVSDRIKCKFQPFQLN